MLWGCCLHPGPSQEAFASDDFLVASLPGWEVWEGAGWASLPQQASEPCSESQLSYF